MSTKSSLYYYEGGDSKDHALNIHIYKEMHDYDATYLEIECSMCNAGFKIAIGEHIAEMLKNHLEKIKPSI